MKIKPHLCLSYLFLTANCLFAQNIHRTACNGNLSRLDSLLETSSINVKDNRGRSLLQWAVACKQKEVFDVLVKRGIDINAKDNQGKTAMHISVGYNNEEYFEYLSSHQLDKNWIKDFGPSLLETAILKKNNRFVKKILEKGVDINAVNERGSSPLDIASRIGASDIKDILLSLGADPNTIRNISLGGNYMGQEPPGLTPRVFAPNFISTEEYEFASVFNSKGDEFYYGVDVNGKAETRFTKLEDGVWTKPVTILSHEKYGYNDPFLSPDENRLYVISQRPLDGGDDAKGDYDIWYVEREGQTWSKPINAGPNINSEGNEYYISFTKEGTMYFSSSVNAPEERKNYDQDIYYSEFQNGEFQKAIVLPKSINTEAYEADVFIDPNETYLIFCSTRDDSFGRGDLYISFKKPDGSWTLAKNMGSIINTVNHELCPYVSPDGKYFFYTSNEDIFWVSSEIFDELK